MKIDSPVTASEGFDERSNLLFGQEIAATGDHCLGRGAALRGVADFHQRMLHGLRLPGMATVMKMACGLDLAIQASGSPSRYRAARASCRGALPKHGSCLEKGNPLAKVGV